MRDEYDWKDSMPFNDKARKEKGDDAMSHIFQIALRNTILDVIEDIVAGRPLQDSQLQFIADNTNETADVVEKTLRDGVRKRG